MSYEQMLTTNTHSKSHRAAAIKAARRYLSGKMTSAEATCYADDIDLVTALALCVVSHPKDGRLTSDTPFSWVIERQLAAHGLIESYRVAQPYQVAWLY